MTDILEEAQHILSREHMPRDENTFTALWHVIRHLRSTATAATVRDYASMPSPSPKTIPELHAILNWLVANGYKPDSVPLDADAHAVLFAAGRDWHVSSHGYIYAGIGKPREFQVYLEPGIRRDVAALAVVPAEPQPAEAGVSDDFSGVEIGRTIPGWHEAGSHAQNWAVRGIAAGRSAAAHELADRDERIRELEFRNVTDVGTRDGTIRDMKAKQLETDLFNGRLINDSKVQAGRISELEVKLAAWEPVVSAVCRAGEIGRNEAFDLAKRRYDAIPANLRPGADEREG